MLGQIAKNVSPHRLREHHDFDLWCKFPMFHYRLRCKCVGRKQAILQQWICHWNNEGENEWLQINGTLEEKRCVQIMWSDSASLTLHLRGWCFIICIWKKKWKSFVEIFAKCVMKSIIQSSEGNNESDCVMLALPFYRCIITMNVLFLLRLMTLWFFSGAWWWRLQLFQPQL